jgi:hypothetical protein
MGQRTCTVAISSVQYLRIVPYTYSSSTCNTVRTVVPYKYDIDVLVRVLVHTIQVLRRDSEYCSIVSHCTLLCSERARVVSHTNSGRTSVHAP